MKKRNIEVFKHSNYKNMKGISNNKTALAPPLLHPKFIFQDPGG
jgi:hypothetical protein